MIRVGAPPLGDKSHLGGRGATFTYANGPSFFLCHSGPEALFVVASLYGQRRACKYGET